MGEITKMGDLDRQRVTSFRSMLIFIHTCFPLQASFYILRAWTPLEEWGGPHQKGPKKASVPLTRGYSKSKQLVSSTEQISRSLPRKRDVALAKDRRKRTKQTPSLATDLEKSLPQPSLQQLSAMVFDKHPSHDRLENYLCFPLKLPKRLSK